MELLNSIWNTLSPFLVGYLVFATIFALIGLAIFILVVREVVKMRKDFYKMRMNNLNLSRDEFREKWKRGRR